MPLLEEITMLLPSNIDMKQISEEAVEVINKVYREDQLTSQDLEVLLNPTEVAVLLSAKYRRSVNHRYVKEITRPIKSKTTDHVTPARLTHDKVAGKTFLYKTGKVVDVRLRKQGATK